MRRISKKTGPSRKLNWNLIHTLYETGLMPSEIRDITQYNLSSIYNILYKIGLLKRQRNAVRINWVTVELLYKKGFTDKEIAAKLECSDRSVCAWRNGRGLPYNACIPEGLRLMLESHMVEQEVIN